MKVKGLLNENNWIKNTSILNKNDCPILMSEADDACKFCLGGAILYCYDLVEYYKWHRYFLNKYGKSLVEWNDSPERTWEDVEQLIKDLDI